MESNLTITLVAIFFGLWYLLLANLTSTKANDLIYTYTHYGTRDWMYPSSVINYLKDHKKGITFYCGAVFPLYWSFMFGAFIGNEIYNILTDRDDERRIASWVV